MRPDRLILGVECGREMHQVWGAVVNRRDYKCRDGCCHTHTPHAFVMAPERLQTGEVASDTCFLDGWHVS